MFGASHQPHAAQRPRRRAHPGRHFHPLLLPFLLVHLDLHLILLTMRIDIDGFYCPALLPGLTCAPSRQRGHSLRDLSQRSRRTPGTPRRILITALMALGVLGVLGVSFFLSNNSTRHAGRKHHQISRLHHDDACHRPPVGRQPRIEHQADAHVRRLRLAQRLFQQLDHRPRRGRLIDPQPPHGRRAGRVPFDAMPHAHQPPQRRPLGVVDKAGQAAEQPIIHRLPQRLGRHRVSPRLARQRPRRPGGDQSAHELSSCHVFPLLIGRSAHAKTLSSQSSRSFLTWRSLRLCVSTLSSLLSLNFSSLRLGASLFVL